MDEGQHQSVFDLNDNTASPLPAVKNDILSGMFVKKFSHFTQ